MRGMICFGLLSLFVTSSLQAEGPVLPEALHEVASKVCGFCHFPDFFDESSGLLIDEKFIAKTQVILDRLQRPAGTPGRMPPKRSAVVLTDEERQAFVDFLTNLQPTPEVVEEQDSGNDSSSVALAADSP